MKKANTTILLMKKRGNIILYFFGFLILTSSIAFNTFHISEKRSFFSLDEALMMGRMVQSQKSGLLSSSGFAGVVYDKKCLPDSIKNNPDFYESYIIRDLIINLNIANQFRYYLGEDTNIPNDFYVYTSQSGGYTFFMSAINSILPFQPYLNLTLLKLLNAALLSLMLFLFIGWCNRNFGFVSAIVVFLLIFISPWISFLGGSLWWCVWIYFLPFITVLLLLEKQNNHPEKVSNSKIVLAVFFAVFIKHLLYGYEFGTTILLAIYPPIIYYYWLQQKRLSSFISFSFKVGIAALVAVVLQSIMFFLQLGSFKGGGLLEGIQYITFLFKKRATLVNHDDLGYTDVLTNVLDRYINGAIFDHKLWKAESYLFSYLVLIIIVLILCLFIYLFVIKRTKQEKDIIPNRKYVGLFIATAFSILCPLSWLIIFLEHASVHPHRDFIVWYVPFMLYCFLIIGISITLFLKKIKNIIGNN